MISKHLLVGASVLAFAATAASAQTSTNTRSVQCGAQGSNSCTVTNNTAGNDRNQGTIRVTGTGNVATIDQVGDDNRSFITIAGDNNLADHDQTGDEHYSASNITGDENTSQIFQDDESNSATVTITGDRSSSTVNQSVGGVGSGQDNVATVLLRGNDLQSTVSQGGTAGGVDEGGNTATVDLLTENESGTAGDFVQSSDITQSSRGNTARVLIRGGANDGSANIGAGQNTSTISQNNTLFTTNNPASQNVADVSLNGLGLSSDITQDGVSNRVQIDLNRGGTGDTGTGAAAGSSDSFNGLGFEANRRAGNEVTIDQSGRNLSVLVSSGGRSAGQGRGNILNVTQEGVAGGPAGTEGRDHSATVYQFGQLSSITVTQTTNTSGSAQTTANPNGAQFGSVADVSQSAFGSTMTLTQNGTNTALLSQGGGSSDTGDLTSGNNILTVDQTDTGDTVTQSNDPFGGTSSGVTLRNSAAVSQAGRFNTGTIVQEATNASSTIFQRRGSSNSLASINQGGPAPTTGFGSTVTQSATGNVTASIDQGGNAATATIRQNGSDLNASISQNPTNFSSAGVGVTGTSAQVLQTGRFNSASVSQGGSNASATVIQQADVRPTGSTLRNSIVIEQTGGRTSNGNFATARQANTAGVSVANGGANGTATPGTTGSGAQFPNARAPGSNPSEIVIRQNNTAAGTGNANNSATVEQRGRGQYARIEQTGRLNEAGILQEITATNSVAIIEQTGRGNTFFITQDAGGQYFRVVQDGSGNNVVTGSGPTNTAGNTPGGTGGTTAPNFTTTTP